MNYYSYRNDGRGFLAPFLLGGLGGAAVVGLARPRPVFVSGNGSYYPPSPPPYYPTPIVPRPYMYNYYF